MKQRLLPVLIMAFIQLPAWASYETDSLLTALDGYISQKEQYIVLKRDRIQHLMNNVTEARYKNDYKGLFNLYDQLHNEYQSFTYDSAFKYVNRLNTIAPLTGDKERMISARIKMGFTLLSSGLFKESLDTLISIDSRNCSLLNKQDLYSTIARTYYDLADYDNDVYFAGIYRKSGNQYLDSAIALMNKDTPDYWSAVGLQRMKSNDIKGSADAFNLLLSKYSLSDHQYAIATSSLGYVYTLLDRKNEAVDMLIRAAIADIKASTKETVALRNLAVLLQEKGEIDRAYHYIKIALEDATFYNARHRKIEVGAVLPIIEGERLRIVEKQKKELGTYSIIVTILSFLVILFSVVIFLQLRKLISVRRILQETNRNLQEMNVKLTESNIIKEEYIGYFFNINSEFLEKIENYRKNILRRLAGRQYDELENVIKSTDLKKERENMYTNFDKIFLKLFPGFIEEFNSFFNEEDRIKTGNDELLNADLRIIALMRLGINDSEKIAKFLGFSVNTVYTYKTKLKHKAIDRDNFDENILKIKAL